MRTFLDEVRETPGGEHILACIQCGTCTGSCPMAARMEHAPRQTIAMVRAGLRDEVLSNNSMWFCLSCYTCTVRCPRGVHAWRLIYGLAGPRHAQRLALRAVLHGSRRVL